MGAGLGKAKTTITQKQNPDTSRAWLQKIRSAAESAYGRELADDDDLISALQNERFERQDETLAAASRKFGYEFMSPLELFRYLGGDRMSDFGPVERQPGCPTAFELAEKRFARSFRTAKDLSDFLAEDPKRDAILQKEEIAAGWRAKKKRPSERISLKKADELFNAFAVRIAKANSNRKFAFFVEEVLLYGSYLRRDTRTVGDIDIAISFAMKSKAKLDQRIAYYMHRQGLDWKGGYERTINFVLHR